MAPLTDCLCSLPPVPAAVVIDSCVSTSGGYAVVLNWSCPQGGYDKFQVHVGGNIIKEGECSKPRTVGELQPARSYKATVTTLWRGLSASAASTTCHTESGGETLPAGPRAGEMSSARCLPTPLRVRGCFCLFR